jgi:hypothetical protein
MGRQILPNGWANKEVANGYSLIIMSPQYRNLRAGVCPYPVTENTPHLPLPYVERGDVVAGRSSADMGAQLLLRSLLRASYQIARSDPQKDSREREDNRECGNDCFGVVMGKVPKTITVDTERGRERGNTFLKILGCGIVIYLLNAFLKWLGTFNDHYDGN